jgi:hypothetical protein
MLKQNDSIVIRAVQNGWIVSPDNYGSERSVSLWTETFVFQSFKEMTRFLEEHFEYRCGVLNDDAGELE